jgi:threonine dehydrogenase-like Zn-dependent dehydrogenase
MVSFAMRALVYDGKVSLHRDVAPHERPRGEARVRVRLAGICDTDLQIARGYMAFRGTLGHEFVGEVIECDDASWLGKRVVSDINAGCGTCDECLHRQGHHCARRTVVGIVGRDGALADELIVPERCLVEVPDGVPDECAVFAEPLAAALHATDDLGGVPSDDARVAVLGDGKLGLLIAMAPNAGWARPVLIGHHAHKLERVAKYCLETRLESSLDSDPPPPFDVVIEATGTSEGLRRALSLLVPRGTLVLKTTVAGMTQVDLSPVVVNELRIVGSRCGTIRDAVGTLALGLDPRPLIAARFGLDDAERAFAAAATRGTLKVVVDPRA